MRTNLTRKVTGYAAIMSVVTCSLTAPAVYAIPSQGGVIASAKPTTDAYARTKPEIDKTTKASVLVRNTASKPETAPLAAAAPEKEQKTHDKKTISRCWKRLMDMVREVNHAHHKKSK